jgi:hypothetical protein
MQIGENANDFRAAVLVPGGRPVESACRSLTARRQGLRRAGSPNDDPAHHWTTGVGASELVKSCSREH